MEKNEQPETSEEARDKTKRAERRGQAEEKEKGVISGGARRDDGALNHRRS